GLATAGLVYISLPSPLQRAAVIPLEVPTTCYSCLWDGYGPQLRNEVIEFYRQYRRPDRLVMGDARYILWRASSNSNCDGREEYRAVAKNDPDAQRRMVAFAILGMGAPECGQDGTSELRSAAALAKELDLPADAEILAAVARNEFKPKTAPRTEIERAIKVPLGAKVMILGESKIEINPGMRIGVQVDRVARDWVSYQMNWDFKRKPLPAQQVLSYHEGAFLQAIAGKTAVEIHPLTGTLIARIKGQWFAPDEHGRFRFAVLGDKVQYPTSHERGDIGWIEDTHGISALAGHAIQRRMQLVVGCGDSEGKAEAADHLSHQGIHVAFPGDRYQDVLLGYTGSGVLIGGAPVKEVAGKTVIGAQPIRFDLRETIVVEDSDRPFPMQYYNSGARYFRRLNGFVPLKLVYVNVDAPDQVHRILTQAKRLNASSVAVRIATLNEAIALRTWLGSSPRNRAILFHSALYRYAQPLFRDFPQQVTFGDLRPRFE
ncbi:MAG: hypothetical protein ABIP12_03385, partial [Terriglobales bacterium]